MKNKKQLVEDALSLAKKNTIPTIEYLELSIDKGKMLASTYDADKDIVLIGICLMDIQLSEAIKQGKQQEHGKMAAIFAKDFLQDYDLTKEDKEKIINCIEAHHGQVSFTCIEAEVCANADCYRFIHPIGIFIYDGIMSKQVGILEERVRELKNKLEEKYSILSLEKAKKDLEGYYQSFLNIFNTVLNEER